MKQYLLFPVAIIILLANCTPMKSFQQIPDSEKLLAYERTPCFGFCPTYRVEILPDGRAYFIGRQYVPVVDTIELNLPPQVLNRVKSILKHPDYLDYRLEEPEYQITDLPGLHFTDYTNNKKYELDMVIPPAIQVMTDIIDTELTRRHLIYDRSTYPLVQEEVILQIKNGIDPRSLVSKGENYELEYQKALGSGIHVYLMTFSILNRDNALVEVKQLKGVQNAQFNHLLQRRSAK